MRLLMILFLLMYLSLYTFLICFWARKHSWKMALIRMGMTVASVVIAVPLAKTVAFAIVRSVWEWSSMKGGETLDAFFHEIPLAEESIVAILSLLIAPLLFVFFFVILRHVFSTLGIILDKKVPAVGAPGKHDAPIACGIGALNGLMIGIITLIPLCSVLPMMGDVAGAFLHETDVQQTKAWDSMEDSVIVEGLDNLYVANDLLENPIGTVVTTLETPVYNWLTSTSLRGGETPFQMDDDLCDLGRTVGDILCAVDTLDGDFAEPDKATLHHAVDTLTGSPWTSAMGAEVLLGVARQWQAGEPFLGVYPPETAEMVQPAVRALYEIWSTESTEDLRGDLHTVMDVLGTLALNGFFDDGVSSSDLLVRLTERTNRPGGKTLREELRDMLAENQHMAPLAAELDAMTTKVVSSVLSDELRNNDNHAPAIADVAVTLTDAMEMEGEERAASVCDAARNALKDTDIVVPDEVVVDISNDIIDECGGDGEITGDEVKEYLLTLLENDDETIMKIIDSNDLSAFLTQPA